jgi:hypothetical protein
MPDVEKTSISPIAASDDAETKGEVIDIAGDGIHVDQGRELFERSLQYDSAQLERDSIKVRRKLDFIVLPMMMTTYMLSFLDKQTQVNLAIA